MEPITIFGVSNSVSAIAKFGLELTKFLKEAIDIYPPAYPGEDLKTRFHAIDVANDALSKIEGLLREEGKNLLENRKLALFSEKALTDVQDAAVQCLKIFWRIEDYFLRKGDSKNLELRILKRLSKFLTEVRSTSMQSGNDSPPVLKLVALGETDKLSKGQKHGRAFSTADKLLDRYNSQLYGLQVNLLLVFQVVHLRVILTKPKQSLNDMFGLPKLYKEIKELAAEMGITDDDCYRCKETWKPWTFGSDSVQRRRTRRRNLIGRRGSLSSASSEFGKALERDYPISKDFDSKDSVLDTQDHEYPDIQDSDNTDGTRIRQNARFAVTPDTIMIEKDQQNKKEAPVHNENHEESDIGIPAGDEGRGVGSFLSGSPTPIEQNEMHETSPESTPTSTIPHNEESHDEHHIMMSWGQKFEGQLVMNAIDRVEPRRLSSTEEYSMRKPSSPGDWEALEPKTTKEIESQETVGVEEGNIATNPTIHSSGKLAGVGNRLDSSPKHGGERRGNIAKHSTTDQNDSTSALKGHTDSKYNGVGLSPDILKGLKRHILHSVPDTQRISKSNAPAKLPEPDTIDQEPEEAAFVFPRYAAYIIRDFDTRGFGDATLIPSTFAREPFSEEDIVRRIVKLNLQGPSVIEKKLSLTLSSEIQIRRAVGEISTREHPNSKYEWNLAQFEETRGPFSDGSIMVYLRRTIRGVISREALGKGRSGDNDSRSQRFVEAIEEMNYLQTLPRNNQDFHPTFGRDRSGFAIGGSRASSPPTLRRRLRERDETEESKDIGEKDREGSLKRMKDNQNKILRSLLKEREDVAVEAESEERRRGVRQEPGDSHRIDGTYDSDYDSEERVRNTSRQRRPPPLVVDNKIFNISPEHAKPRARRRPIHPSLPKKNYSTVGNTPVWGGSEVSTPGACTMPTPEPFSEDDFLCDTDVDGVSRDIDMDIVRNLYLEWTPAWEEEGEDEDEDDGLGNFMFAGQ